MITASGTVQYDNDPSTLKLFSHQFLIRPKDGSCIVVVENFRWLSPAKPKREYTPKPHQQQQHQH